MLADKGQERELRHCFWCPGSQTSHQFYLGDGEFKAEPPKAMRCRLLEQERLGG